MSIAERNRLPLYRLLAEEIRKSIKCGVWQPGDQLPSEPELARRYAVSRATVREALRSLQQEGSVTAQRGYGTFVALQFEPPQVGIDTLYGISDAIRLQGQEPGTGEISFQTVPIEGDLALRFPLEKGSAVAVERVRTADGRPVALSRNTVPSRYLTSPEWRERVGKGSLFQVLMEAGVALSYALTHLSAEEAGERTAAKLDVTPGTALLLMREMIYDQAGAPVVSSEDHYRTDRIEVSVMRRRNGQL